MTLGFFLQKYENAQQPQLKIIRGERKLNVHNRILEINDIHKPYISETIIKTGDNLNSVLQRLKISNIKDIQRFISNDKNAKKLAKLMSGRPIYAATDSVGNLIWLKYLHTPNSELNGKVASKYLQITRNPNNCYKASEEVEIPNKHVRVAFGNILSSLFEATESAGIPNFIALQMTDILSNKIDFLRELRHGDQFIIIYEVQTINGYNIGSGKILAMEFKNHDKQYNAIWFDNNGLEIGAYYDFDGNSLQRAFLRNAVKFTRISSTFGKRLHPINKTWVEHKGIDYVAPTGTPIYATADGVVEFVGWQNGYGKVTILKHYDKYSTLYAHQSQIAPKISKGKKVYQGQLLGYVGSTGWATGPHLHYELRINNKPVNPLTINLPISKKIDKSNFESFKNTMAFYQTQINFLAKFNNESIKLASSN
ncbi:peptidase [Candidatus Kinetoplastibacterium crithidii (ex Angomonas deanei ATCC 30255)]|nr:peptidase [Candidatus Kinetoplastibacterium crithidii (ex Angomonas deanei ATCC 30255)]